jgi:hypothetical protein
LNQPAARWRSPGSFVQGPFCAVRLAWVGRSNQTTAYLGTYLGITGAAQPCYDPSAKCRPGVQEDKVSIEVIGVKCIPEYYSRSNACAHVSPLWIMAQRGRKA